MHASNVGLWRTDQDVHSMSTASTKLEEKVNFIVNLEVA
jgi:hypothetical protein